MFARNLGEDAASELIDEALCDCQILDHVVVPGLVFSLCLVDYQLRIVVDLNVLRAHLVS